MASSDGAMITAVAGRGISSADDYKILLPSLPSEAATVNSVFLHCDVTGRPYRIEDFREELQRLQILGDVASFGAYQMNHVWLVTFHSASTRNRLLAAKELTVKGKRCILIDPKNSETCLKLHWVPYHVPDDTVRRALEPYGKVHEVTRETWRAQGFQGVQSTTRLVGITLKEGVSKESVPHQLRFFGGSALVLVPGRAPLCLRCKKTGHIRKDCRVPRCDDCHRYGHTRENCVKSYAVATAGPLPDENTDLIMDEAEAELAASANASVRTLPAAPRIAEMPTSETREPSPQVELPLDAPSGEPRQGGMEAPVTTPGKESQLTAKIPEPDGGFSDSEMRDEAMVAGAATPTKRPHEQDRSPGAEDGMPTQQRSKLVTPCRGRRKPPTLRAALDNRLETDS
ncbi:uncharacterized protein LOC115330832 [Ixodes scapularis]|uniref:uncharacterized protein LOC115330832 n=1 Tax=Ixodes scapularis TaxID=6945 RepID=UPI001A9FEC74|nr:uncharacterized protein LOC115330832 [Ixodes scapularis]